MRLLSPPPLDYEQLAMSPLNIIVVAFVVGVAFVASVRFAKPESWRRLLGIAISRQQATVAAVAFAVAAFVAHLLLPIILSGLGIKIAWPDLLERAGYLIVAVNEEMLLRGLVLGLAVRVFPTRDLAAFVLAVAFAFGTYAFFLYVHPAHIALPWTAVGALICVGMTLNNLFLAVNHIGLAWAFHAGCGSIWLLGTFSEVATGRVLTMPELVARLLGSPDAIVLAGAASLASSLVLLSSRDPRKRIEKLFRDDNAARRDAPYLTIETWRSLRDSPDTVLVDVRQRIERDVSIIPGAISRDTFEENLAIYRNHTIVCYCTIGGRAGSYTEKLRAQGYKAFNLKGSVLSWAHAGLRFVDSEGRETRRVHVSGPKWNLLPPDYHAVW